MKRIASELYDLGIVLAVCAGAEASLRRSAVVDHLDDLV